MPCHGLHAPLQYLPLLPNGRLDIFFFVMTRGRLIELSPLERGESSPSRRKTNYGLSQLLRSVEEGCGCPGPAGASGFNSNEQLQVMIARKMTNAVMLRSRLKSLVPAKPSQPSEPSEASKSFNLAEPSEPAKPSRALVQGLLSPERMRECSEIWERDFTSRATIQVA